MNDLPQTETAPPQDNLSIAVGFFRLMVKQQFNRTSQLEGHVDPRGIQGRFINMLQRNLLEALQDPRKLLFSILSVSEQLPAMMDLVWDQTHTQDELRKAVNRESWLSKELLGWINAPRFRQLVNAEHDYADSLDDALAMFNGEQLIYVLADFTYQQTAQKEGQSCTLLIRRIIEWSYETAGYCELLAQHANLPESQLKLAGLFQGLAPLAITQLFAQLYEAQLQGGLKKMRQAGQKALHDELQQLPVPAYMLMELLCQQQPLQLQLLEQMGETGNRLARVQQEVYSDLPITLISPQARVLRQSLLYSQYRWLNDACELTPTQSHHLLSSLNLSPEVIAQLARLRRR